MKMEHTVRQEILIALEALKGTFTTAEIAAATRVTPGEVETMKAKLISLLREGFHVAPGTVRPQARMQKALDRWEDADRRERKNRWRRLPGPKLRKLAKAGYGSPTQKPTMH